MKALLALAKSNRAAMEEEKGSWRGSSQLRGGWAGGKDLGEVSAGELSSARLGRSSNAADDDMPSSTSSFESDPDEDPERGLRAVRAASSSVAAVSSGSKKRSHEDGERAEHDQKHGRKDKHKHKKDKDKEKHHKKHKHKQKHDKSEKKKRRLKHRHHDSD